MDANESKVPNSKVAPILFLRIFTDARTKLILMNVFITANDEYVPMFVKTVFRLPR